MSSFIDIFLYLINLLKSLFKICTPWEIGMGIYILFKLALHVCVRKWYSAFEYIEYRVLSKILEWSFQFFFSRSCVFFIPFSNANKILLKIILIFMLKRQITIKKFEKINVNFPVMWPVESIGKYLPQFSYVSLQANIAGMFSARNKYMIFCLFRVP